jgi:hypothetical protein
MRVHLHPEARPDVLDMSYLWLISQRRQERSLFESSNRIVFSACLSSAYEQQRRSVRTSNCRLASARSVLAPVLM